MTFLITYVLLYFSYELYCIILQIFHVPLFYIKLANYDLLLLNYLAFIKQIYIKLHIY